MTQNVTHHINQLAGDKNVNKYKILHNLSTPARTQTVTLDPLTTMQWNKMSPSQMGLPE